jgi:hypothetical protein
MVRCECAIANSNQARPCCRHAVQWIEVGRDFPFTCTDEPWIGDIRSQLSAFKLALPYLNIEDWT